MGLNNVQIITAVKEITTCVRDIENNPELILPAIKAIQDSSGLEPTCSQNTSISNLVKQIKVLEKTGRQEQLESKTPYNYALEKLAKKLSKPERMEALIQAAEEGNTSRFEILLKDSALLENDIKKLFSFAFERRMTHAINQLLRSEYKLETLKCLETAIAEAFKLSDTIDPQRASEAESTIEVLDYLFKIDEVCKLDEKGQVNEIGQKLQKALLSEAKKRGLTEYFDLGPNKPEQ